MATPQVIVRVGKSSDLRLRNIKAYRAITFREVARLLDIYPNTMAIIMQDISDGETALADNTLSRFTQSGKSVFFYTDNPNENLQNLASNFGKNVSTTLEELQRDISDTISIKVSTKWGIKEAENKEETISEEVPEQATEDTHIEVEEAIAAVKESKPTVIQHPTIKNKEDLEKLGDIDDDGDSFDISDLIGTLHKEPETHLQEYKDKNASDLAKLLASVMQEKEELKGELSRAYDRIKTILDLQTAIEDERDMYKQMLTDYESSDDIMEDPVSGDEYGEVEKQLAEANRLNTELRQKYDELVEADNTHKIRCDELEKQLEQAKTDFESKLAETEQSSTKSKADLELEISSAQARVTELEAQLSQAESDRANELQSKVEELEDKLSEVESELSDTRRKHDIFQGAHKNSIEVIEKLSNSVYELKILVDEKSSEVESLTAELNKANNSLDSKNEEIQQISDRLAKAENVSEEYRQNIDRQIAEARSGAATELAIAQGELEAIKIDRDRLQEMLVKTKSELRERQNELELLNTAVGPDLEASKKMAEANAVLTEANKTLGKTVGLLKQELSETKNRLTQSTTIISSLENKLSHMNTSVLAMTKGGIGAVNKLKLSCDYTGRGFIIPVFGSGSYGITTMAMSLARKITDSSVLYLDFDIVNPKADGWFNKSPLIDGLTDFKDPLTRTGFGALLDKNTDYVIDHEKMLFQRVVETKGGYVDYFSGAYKDIDVTKLVSVDFTQFMNFCGNTYKYVIVDLGRFGSSDISNAIIKMFDEIAYRSIIVTLNNNADARNFGVKANAERLKLGNSVWALNLSETTTIAPIVKRSVGSAKPIIFPREPKFYGTGKTFDKVSILKDKLQLVMDDLMG